MYLKKSFESKRFYGRKRLTRAMECRVWDVDVVDPMMFKEHSRNCYVNGLERPAVKGKLLLEANRNRHKPVPTQR
jgi:hypothetical protein